MNLESLAPAEIRIRLEDVIAVLDEVGVPDDTPEMETPGQRVRALAEALAVGVQNRHRVLDVATEARASAAFAQTVGAAKWKPFPDCDPPPDRDVLALTSVGIQVVVHWDAHAVGFFTTCGTRIWIHGVEWWRELPTEPDAA